MYVDWLLLSLVLFPKFYSILLVVSVAPQRIHSFGHFREYWMAVRVMDTDVTHRSPETATVGSLCQALLSSVQTTAMDVTAFVRRCRSARADLAPATRELSELHMVLALLGGDHESRGGGPAGRKKGARILEELQAHLRPVLASCIAAVLRIDGILRQHGGSDEGEDEGTPMWTARARDEVRDLGRALGTCRGVLGLVSDLVSILASSGSQGVTPDGLRLPDILGQLHNLLRSSSSSALTTSQSQSSNATLAGQQHQTLQVHLGHIIAYAETLAKSKDWEKATRALDEAQEKTAAAAEKEEVRGSIPVTAPLRRIPGSTSRAVTTTTQDAGGMGDNFIVLNRGFENFLVREDGGGRRCSASLLFAPTHRRPEPGSLMAGGPSTGMMVMDGAGLPGMSGTNHSLQPVVQGSTTQANPRKHLGRRTSSVIYTTEKEVAMPVPRDEVTDEALAFAQVPVHVLGRLSLNLVGHVYTGTNDHSPGQGNVSGGSSSADQTSYYNHSLLTVRTDEGYFDDGASARMSDAGSLHDGDLQFSQLDLSKPAPPPGAVSMSMSMASQPLPLPLPAPSSQTTTTLVSQTPLIASQITIPAQQALPPPLALPPTQPLPPLPLPPSSSSQQQALLAVLTSTPAATSQPRPRPRPPPQPLQSSGSSSNNPPEPGQQAPPPQHHHDERVAPTNVQSRSASAPLVYYGPPPPPPAPPGGHHHGLREMRSTSTMNTHAFMTAAMNTQKPLPRTPLVYIPTYPGPFVKTKAVVVGNFSCGKTCLIT